MITPEEKGQIARWNTERGFGFIQPDAGGKQVFVHISTFVSLKSIPETGDIVTYTTAVNTDGRPRAIYARIEGRSSELHPSSPTSMPNAQHTQRKVQSNTIIFGVYLLICAVLVAIIAVIINTSLNGTPDELAEPFRICKIKGNISQNSGRRLYHMPGMEDYENTRINEGFGERWFCTEEDAIRAGWVKAPR